MTLTYTFQYFWRAFHKITGKPETDIKLASKIWFSHYFSRELKEIACINIEVNKDTFMNAHEYLRQFTKLKINN